MLDEFSHLLTLSLVQPSLVTHRVQSMAFTGEREEVICVLHSGGEGVSISSQYFPTCHSRLLSSLDKWFEDYDEGHTSTELIKMLYSISNALHVPQKLMWEGLVANSSVQR